MLDPLQAIAGHVHEAHERPEHDVADAVLHVALVVAADDPSAFGSHDLFALRVT